VRTIDLTMAPEEGTSETGAGLGHCPSAQDGSGYAEANRECVRGAIPLFPAQPPSPRTPSRGVVVAMPHSGSLPQQVHHDKQFDRQSSDCCSIPP